MKRYLLILLCFILLITSSLTGCEQSGEELNEEEEDVNKEEVVNQIQIELPNLSSDTFAFDSFSDEEIANLFESESLDDYLGASPFYTSEAFKAQFKNDDYFLDRDMLIDDIIFYSEMMQLDIDSILLQLDTLMTSTSLMYESLSSNHEDVKTYSEVIDEEYSDQIMYISALSSQIEALSEKSDSEYTQAWIDYLLVHKRIELADLVVTDLAHVMQDAIILYDEYYDAYKDDFEVSFDFEMLMMDIEFVEIFDINIENIFSTISETYGKLEALESGDNYATLSALISHYEIASALQPAVDQLIPREGLSEEAVEFAKESNMYNVELTSSLIAELIDYYEIDTSIYITDKQSSNSMFAVISNPLVALVESNEKLDKHSAATLEQAKKELAKNNAIKPKEKKGFFGTLYNAVRKMPGILLEKASNAVYKTTFDYIATDYGVSKDVIKKERNRVNKEEMGRIKAGTAGSEQINDAISFIEDAEEAISMTTSSMFDENSFAGKTIKLSTKFTLGCLSGGGKGLLKMMDPNATPGELAKATLDVALTTVGGSKSLSKLVENGSKTLTTHLSKIAAPISNLVKNVGTKIASKAGNLVSKLGNTVTKISSKMTGAIQKSGKVNTFVETVSKKVSSSLNNITTKSKSLFSSLYKRGKNLKDKLNTKIPSFAKTAIKSDSFVGSAFGSSYKGMAESFIKGSIYENITKLVDETIPEFVASENENTSIQNGNADDFVSEEDSATDEEESTDVGLSEESVDSDDADANDITEDTDADTNDITEEDIVEEETINEETTSEVEVEVVEHEDASDQLVSEGQIVFGSYTGNYIDSKIGGYSFELNGNNSSIKMTITESSLNIQSYIADSMIDGTGMTYNFDNYNVSNNIVTVTNIDDEGDRQDFIITFNNNGTFNATIAIYDSGQVIGNLKVIGELLN